MDDKVLNMLGLASKARKIIAGSDAVMREIKANRAKIVLISNDSSPKTIDNFRKKCYFYKIPCLVKYKTEEISQSIGKFNHVIAINDPNFSGILLKYLESEIEFNERKGNS